MKNAIIFILCATITAIAAYGIYVAVNYKEIILQGL